MSKRVQITRPDTCAAFARLSLSTEGTLIKHDPSHAEGFLLRPFGITFTDRSGVYWYARWEFTFLDEF